MRTPKSERNKMIVTLRNKDPKAYSFGKIAIELNMTKSQVHKIYHRDKELYKGGR